MNEIDLDLNLPDGKDFISKKVPVSMDKIIEMSEAALPIFAARPGDAERRWAEKYHEPFRLLD
jgi:hypothetical protein